MRIRPTMAALMAAFLLAGCTKDQVFHDPYAGTIIELGFEWNDPVSFCLDSDDHDDLLCIPARWLDGERLQVDVPGEGVSWIGEDGAAPKKKVKSQMVRYVYNPTMRTVTLYLTGGEVVLRWNGGEGCLEGDLFQDDLLTICS